MHPATLSMLPNIICISLADQPTRRAYMARQFEAIGAGYRFLDGIRVDLTAGWPAAYDRQARLAYSLTDLRAGEIGCYLSHRQAWREFLASTDDLCCVLEDDVELHADFCASVEALCRCRESWDLVRLLGFSAQPFKQLQQICGPHYLVDYWRKQPNGTQGYLLTREAAQRLLDHTATIIHPIDNAIDREWEHRLRLRGVEPPILSHVEAFASTIEGRGAGKQRWPAKLKREVNRLTTNLPKQLWSLRKRLHYLFR